MKVAKPETKIKDFRVWCEHCRIRVAPHEERAEAGGKTYHPRCYSQLFPTSKLKQKVSQDS